MKVLLLVALCCVMVLVSGQGRGRPKFSQQGNGQNRRPASAQNGQRGRGKWQRRSGGKDWSDIIKASWNTSLPGDIVINERGFASDNNQVGFLMSKDTELTSAGYNQSFAMIDFGAGKEAIRVELRDPEASNQSADRRSREFWARKKHICFIMDAPLTFTDFSEAIQLRSSFSWAGPIPTGNVKTFVARQANRLADLGTNGVIDRLCGKAAARGLAFSIVADSSVTEPMEKIKVTGHIDPLQPLTSVPYEIKVEAGILAS
ncbi:uncharacterized protein [Magallana gigas]|uniref:uncharacterized protein n=1 Tax=Magallana gigas TaxID=29159 RepID=UPI00333E5547